MSAIAIRPRRATELVDASFQLFRRFYPQFLTVTAITMSPLVFARIMWREVLADPALIRGNPGTLLAGYAIVLGCSMLADAVLVVAVSGGYLDGAVDLAVAFRTAARRLPGLLGATVLRGIVIMGPILLLSVGAAVFLATRSVAPMILLFPFAMVLAGVVYVGTFATIPALLLEQLGPSRAVTRSWRLSKECRAHVFWTLSIGYGLYFVLDMIGSVLGMTAFNMAIATVFGAVIVVLVYPFLAVVQTLLYYDLRVRKEGFDLEMMSRELGTVGAVTTLPAA